VPVIAHKPVAQVNVRAKIQEPVDEAWIRHTALLLDCAALRGDLERVNALIQEFQEKGLPVPPYHGKPRDPEPEPKEPTYRNIELPDDSRGRALNARRIRPAGPRVIDWETYRDTWDDLP
jgi:hypothetical protein